MSAVPIYSQAAEGRERNPIPEANNHHRQQQATLYAESAGDPGRQRRDQPEGQQRQGREQPGLRRRQLVFSARVASSSGAIPVKVTRSVAAINKIRQSAAVCCRWQRKKQDS